MRLVLFIVWSALCACTPTAVEPDDTDPDAPAAQADRDGDGILDVHEGEVDVDGDGLRNPDDEDSDGDGIPDVLEAGDAELLTLPVDSDEDGAADFVDVDSDGNCLGDAAEGVEDTNGDGIVDRADLDDDGDGLRDSFELADCAPRDIDGDGIADHHDLDADGDGISDLWEGGYYGSPHDTDHDGVPDHQDTDSDDDGLGDADEVARGSDPYDSDSDGDGWPDGAEVAAGHDPLDSQDGIDGAVVVVEAGGTGAAEIRVDVPYLRADVALMSDSSCSMSGALGSVKEGFLATVTSLQRALPDVAVASGDFDDYSNPSGVSGELPFRVNSPVTTDLAAVEAAILRTTTAGGGYDTPQAGYEAYYQAATGAGYDLDCDGAYDRPDDVLPFLAHPSDPFGGAGGQLYDASVVGGGTRGGFGFRDSSIPFVVLVQQGPMKDADSELGATPGGCPGDAGHSETVAAFLELGGYPITVDVAGGAVDQGRQLALDTGAVAGGDALAVRMDPGSETFERDLAEYITGAVVELTEAAQWSTVSLELDDPFGLVAELAPASYPAVDATVTSELAFTLRVEGAVAALPQPRFFVVDVHVVANGERVGAKRLVILVPGA